MRNLRSAVVLAALVSATPVPNAQENLTSGRPLPPEQAAYDVLHYGLTLRVDPKSQRLSGELLLRARVVAPTEEIVLDLDQRMQVSAVTTGDRKLEYTHAAGEIRIESEDLFSKEGAEFVVTVAYGGSPRVAPNPPWDGGLTWAKTSDGSPWIATSCQHQGADLWWPCKDQPSDEPRSMDLSVTVPKPLVAACNGRLVSVEDADDGWHTWNWHVSTPINTYGVALNIAPYKTISDDYTSVTGETFPVTFWVLPENEAKGRELFVDILKQVRFFEETFGPYPFRADKYGIAETPHLGMEHQSIIAYGNEYRGNPWGKQRGFDFLHHHEMAHEWWANLVTAENWADFWIHESFATYAQALYVEELHGFDDYIDEMRWNLKNLANVGAVAPRGSRSTGDMYFTQLPDAPGPDIYFKGSWILHTLRWLLGDEDFFLALRRMAYPDPALERVTDGSHCRLTNTEEIREIAERVSGQDLTWFFEVYLRQPKLPRLESRIQGNHLELRWSVPGDLAFPMPVEVRIGDDLRRVEMPDGTAILPLDGEPSIVIDPNDRVLRVGSGSVIEVTR